MDQPPILPVDAWKASGNEAGARRSSSSPSADGACLETPDPGNLGNDNGYARHPLRVG